MLGTLAKLHTDTLQYQQSMKPTRKQGESSTNTNSNTDFYSSRMKTITTAGENVLLGVQG